MNQTQWTDREVYQALQDRLGFGHYSQVLGEIVAEADTPLTVGIFGPWGSGKTSLMRLVQEGLKGQERPPLSVWFNAWKYDQEEALWRALVIQVLNAFRPERQREQVVSDAPRHPMQPDMPLAEPALGPEERKLNRRLDDLEASLYRTVEREEVGGVIIDWEKLLKGSVMGLTHLSLSALPGIGAVLGKMMEEAQKKLGGEDLDTLFEAIQRERRKIYREHIRSLEQFQSQFEGLVKDEVVDKGRRMVVFIDDLDRCLPEKAIEVLEALKLFLDVPGCVFFLGADREVIQRGIRVKYKGFLVDSDDPLVAGRRIPITGDNYLEKIVQLPFHLLPLDETRVEQFIQECGIELPDAGCADIFAAGLEANPRKIKRALNIFRLLYKLAQIRQAEFTLNGRPVQIKPQLLAKVVVIQGRYPSLYNDLVEYPALLHDLERHFEEGSAGPAPSPEGGEPAVEAETAGEQQPASPGGTGSGDATLLEKYRHLRPLQRLLGRGDRFAGLPLAEVRLYLYLTYTTDESGQSPARDQQAVRWLEELLSSDPSKIKSTVAAIQEDGPVMVADFQRRLLAILEQPGPAYSLAKHLSAGTALAWLGDPRDFNEMVPIPAGEYPLGKAGIPQYLEGFKTGKYPVTCVQYKKFLDETPHQPAPNNWEPAGRSYPPELANHPVTHVSWHEAQAYCRWAGKRLPSAQEWEAAARGPLGYLYPYGHELRAEASNTAEMRLQGSSPVGAFPDSASPFGLGDMAGNVWEWTGTTGEEGYALKGGAWDTPAELTVCSNSRWEKEPGVKSGTIGFRVAE